ncbi:aminotransferase class IV [Streptomyces sp. M10(2022)]
MAELNGEPVEPSQLQTLALTNYGHFTSMRVDEGRVRGLSLHLERLRRDCRSLFGVDLDLQRVRELARRAAP